MARASHCLVWFRGVFGRCGEEQEQQQVEEEQQQEEQQVVEQQLEGQGALWQRVRQLPPLPSRRPLA